MFDQLDAQGKVVRSGFVLGMRDVLPPGHQWVPHVMPPDQQAAQAAIDAAAAQALADVQEAKADAQVIALATMTPAQAAQWIETNVTSLATAKDALKVMAKIQCLLARQILKD